MGACTETLAALCFIAGISLGVRSVGVYLAILLLTGTARAVGGPAVRTFLPNIVSREAYMSAQARYVSIRQFITIAGPAIGGALVSVGTIVAFACGGAAFLGAAAFLRLVRLERAVPHAALATWRTPSTESRSSGRAA